jgi:D-serine dehydratase
MKTDQHIIDSLNNEQLRERQSIIMGAVLVGGIVGFTIGIIAASLLHKFIVHPLGF